MAVMDPGFPRDGSQLKNKTRGGVSIYYSTKLSRKMHENEENCSRPKFFCVDLPLIRCVVGWYLRQFCIRRGNSRSRVGARGYEVSLFFHRWVNNGRRGWPLRFQISWHPRASLLDPFLCVLIFCR